MQLEFPMQDECSLRASLEEQTGLSIDLVLTKNRSSMLSFVPGNHNSATLRLHIMFLSAGPDVVHALGLWLKRGRCKRSAKVIDTFIAENKHLVSEAKAKNSVRVNTSGEVFDLAELYEQVNREYFDNELDLPITWGKAPSRPNRRRRSIRFGSYSPEDHLIRIHPYLDQPKVPEFFVKYVVFHEMLHAHLGVKTLPSGRRDIHSREFRTIERAYPDYERSIAWHDNPRNLRRLLEKRAS